MKTVATSKLPDVGTTIFTVMSALAREHDAINLSQGFPDFQPPPGLVERVNDYLSAGANQYAPMTGVPALREAIAAKMDSLYGAQVNADTEITVTSGATEALFCAIQAFVHPGDEVVIFDPAYDAYEPAIWLAGGRARRIPLSLPTMAFDPTQFEAAFGPRTRMVIVNSPHNPGTGVVEQSLLDYLADRLADSDCLVLSDEVYEHIVFDGRKHLSVVAHPGLQSRSIAVFSFGKTYHATGWKLGYVIAPAELSAELRKVHQFVTFSTVTPMQCALADFVVSDPEHYLGLPAFYQEKRDLFARLMAPSRFRLLTAAGTYFQLADYSAIDDRPDVAFCRWLTAEHGVAAIPVSVFYAAPPEQRIVRFCFAKEAPTLASAARKLCAI